MDKLKQKLYILLTTAIIVSAGLGWLVLNRFFPAFYSSWYPIIPIFFFIFGLVNIHVLGKTNNKNPRKPVNMFMLLRLLKFLLSFSVLGAYYIINGKEHLKEFGLTFALFYLLYLTLETFFFYKTEKELKKNSK